MPISGEERARELLTHHTLRPGPSIVGHTIQQYEEQHTWIIDQTLILCTPPEYFCLKALLEQADRCVPFAQLAACLPEIFSSEDAEHKTATARMRHLMSSLRGKIWSLGMDIVSLRSVGYILLSNAQEASLPPSDEHAS